MSKLAKEYNFSTVNARPCYSNLNMYGAGGRTRKIVPPVPVTVNPPLFWHMKPHNYNSNQIKSSKVKAVSGTCLPYKTFNESQRNFCS